MITPENAADLTAVVTGGGSGIGEGVVKALAATGVHVYVVGRDAAKLEAVAGGHENVTAAACDVADRDGVGRLFDEIESTRPGVDLVVHAAGLNVTDRALDVLGGDDFDLMMRVNATGTFNVMMRALPGMRTRRSGLIVNICSLSAVRPSPLGGAGYNASKYAMAGFGLSAAEEEKNNGVRVTTIYPGEVETPILDRRAVPPTAEHRARILQPADVAAAVMLVATLPPRAHIPELVIKPTTQTYV